MDKLEWLIAREEIRDLVSRYPVAFDDRDWEEWNKLWTEDTAFVVDGVAIEGLDALRAFAQTCLPDDYLSKHMCGQTVIDLAEDGLSARARTDVVWIAANYDNQIVARYDDTLVKRDGRWLIARREEYPVPFRPGPPPMSAEAVALSSPTMRKESDG